MKRKILLIGGGGHCHSVLDSILSLNIYSEIGIIDNRKTSYQGIPVIGTDEDVPKLYKQGWTEAFITIGSIGNTDIRRHLFSFLKTVGSNIPIIIDPSAIVATDVTIKRGTYIGKKAIINAGASIGECSIINSGAIIEHDCNIGDFSHISPGSIICGHVTIGNDSHIGAGAVVKQDTQIGNSCMIGMGSIVTKNVNDRITAYGNPCKDVNE